MTHKYRRYADRVGIRSSLKETRHFSATQLLAAGVDLNTVSGRLGHAEGSTTLKYYAQFLRPADQRAATVIPAQLDQLRKKEKLRELFRQQPAVPGDLAALAAELGPQAGLDEATALPWLAVFAADGTEPKRTAISAFLSREGGAGSGEPRVAAAADAPPERPRESHRRRQARACQDCGKPMAAKPGAGRPQRYCSSACRQRAHRRRKQEGTAA